MQKSLKKVISKAFTILFFLVAYSLRTLAQEEKVKAFKEGDHILSVSTWLNPRKNIGFQGAMGASYETAIKGTRGLLSVGGFANFSSYFHPMAGYANSIFRQNEFSAGVKLGIHYATQKWDIYGGLMAGGKYSTLGNEVINQNTDSNYINANNLNTITPLISPYLGARYYVTKRIGIQLESTFEGKTSLGVALKF